MTNEAAVLAKYRMSRARQTYAEGEHLMSLFQMHFVKTGIITTDTGKALPRSFEKRQKSDYDDFATVTSREAEKVRSDVGAFVNECAAVLEKSVGAP